MNKYIKYLIPILFFLYGILEKSNIHIPRMYSIDGYVFIAIGLLGVCSYVYIDFFNKKKVDTGEKHDKKILTFVCYIALVMAIVYFGLYLFEIVLNDLLFILTLLIFVICTKSLKALKW
ncbi:hypothetical protein [Sulfurimonas sp.]|uniref:hypothetical protein n=1 Tax=Sulfurimonas sp. TaxID=2022749 RepID=UPI001A05E373|nr:hypothetical protein [Sulfurimonas sp.]MBE0515702.1 hypothetical protein [Sulfurimonas sp.]